MCHFVSNLHVSDQSGTFHLFSPRTTRTAQAMLWHSEPCNPATRPEIPSLKVFCKCSVWKQKACYKITLGLVQQEVGLQMQDPGFCSPAPRCLPASAGPQSIPASIRGRGHVGSISRCQLSRVVFLQPRLGQPAIYRAITDFFQEKQAHLSPFCSGWKAGKAKY